MQDITTEREQLDLSVLERMQTNAPIMTYKKTTLGKVGVIVFNPITRKPEERILEGNHRDPIADIEKMIIKIFDEPSHLYFKSVNKNLLERGLIAPHNSELAGVDMGNAISDDDIDEILSQPFYTLKSRLEKFTSHIPAERILVRAIELNKAVKTIEHIKSIIAKLQEGQSLEATDKRLKDHYHNLEPVLGS